MDRIKAGEIQKAITEFVASHPEWGVKVSRNSASYGPAEVRIGLTLRSDDEDSARAEFARVASCFGLKPEAYGAVIPGVGTLIGFSTRRTKYPVRVKQLSGREMLYTEAMLLRLPANLKVVL